MRRAFARTPSASNYVLLEQSLQSTPSPLCGLAAWPLLGAWRLLHVLGAPQGYETKILVAETHCFRAESLGIHLTKKKQRELAPL